MRSALMPFEDEPLERVVGALIAAAGGVPVSDTTHADLLLFVHTSRLESATTARFAADIGLAAARARHGVIVADVDPKGDVQGADSAFTGALVEAGAFERLDGYASWNTASNTIGTALAQGLMHRGRAASVRSAAQQWFLLDRLFDDLLYRRVLRPEATTMVRAAGWNGAGLTRAQSDSLADRLTVRLGEEIDRLRARRPSIDATRPTCIPRDGPRLRLPWDRLFEAELTFEVPRDCGRK
jgi:hypothetical protein